MLNVLKNYDLVICGLNYFKNQNDYEQILISQENIKNNDFLWTNPGIQNSNIFIRLNTFLMAGLFDEALSSCIDRDLMIKVFQLNPKYKIISKYLVNIDANNDRKRITNNKNKKLKGLSFFYIKWKKLMDKKNETKFFDRNQLAFNLSRKQINNYINKNFWNNNLKINDKSKLKPLKDEIVISFIISKYEYGLRILNDIKLKFQNVELIILRNIKNDIEWNILLNKIISTTSYFKIINLELIKKYLDNCNIKLDDHKHKYITSISIARDILHYYTYVYTSKKDIIWIVDDDMIFNQIILNKNKLEIKNNINWIKGLKCEFKKPDLLIGSYCNDPGVPLLSLLRCQLIDFYFKSNYQVKNICEDYYYDLSIKNYLREFPFPSTTNNINDVFNNALNSRKLYLSKQFDKNIINRGGNTIVTNNNVLVNKQLTIIMNNEFLRRGDYLWLLLNKNKFNIKKINLGINHFRKTTIFNYENEVKKLINDLIGYSFNQSIDINNLNEEEMFIKFKNNFYFRLAKIVENFIRIIGLLKTINNNTYIKFFSINNLDKIINYAKKFINKQDYFKNTKNIKNYLKESNKNNIINCDKKFIKNGNEASIYHDKKFIYKSFYNELNKDTIINLEKFSNLIINNENFYHFKIVDNNIIQYRYEKIKKKIDFSYLKDQLISIAKTLYYNNINLDNIKPDNFILTKNNQLKFIDYGKDINFKNNNNCLKRIYELIKYENISPKDFYQLIQNTYLNEETNRIINNGFNDFLNLVLKQPIKEQIHDEIIFNNFKFKNKTILDYGCGKCKIINHYSKNNNTYCFDIDLKTMNERSINNINLTNIDNKYHKYFQVIFNNLVLCCTDNNTNDEIINNISNLLSRNGLVILSICNPFTNNIENTILRQNKIDNYDSECKFIKQCKVASKTRIEFHRSISYYENLFNKNKLFIKEIIETNGYDFNNFIKIPEHLVFVLSKTENENKNNNQEIEIIINMNINNKSFSKLYRCIESIRKQKYKKFAINCNVNIKNKQFYDYLIMLNKYDKKLKNKIFLNENTINDNNKKYISLSSNQYLLNEHSLKNIVSNMKIQKNIYKYSLKKPLALNNYYMKLNNDEFQLGNCFIMED